MNLTEQEAAAYLEYQNATKQLADVERAMAEAQNRYKAALNALNQVTLARTGTPPRAAKPKAARATADS